MDSRIICFDFFMGGGGTELGGNAHERHEGKVPNQ